MNVTHRTAQPLLFEYVASSFEAEGVNTVFGLMGDGNMRWLAEMAARPNVQVVHGRHEAAALAMADGWAQATGQLGVCSVTCGPGVTNLVTSLRVAAHNRTPLVVLAGDTPLKSPTHYQQFDIADLQSSAGVPVIKIRSLAETPEKIRMAFATARRDLTPVVLTLPYDLAEEECDLAPYRATTVALQSKSAADEALAVCAARLQAAQHVLILVGRGAVASDSLEGVRELAHRLHATTGVTVKALGALHGETNDLGVVGGFSSETVRHQIASAEVVLALGASLSWFTTLGGALLDPHRVIQVVDRQEPWDPGYLFEPSQRVIADCRIFVDQLLQVLPASQHPTENTRTAQQGVAELPSSGVRLSDSDGFDPVQALATVRRAFDRPVQLVVGAGHFWNHVMEMPEPPEAVGLQIHNGFGAIAHAFPAAIGAACAADTPPTVVIEGDGSLMMNLQEIETAVRSRVPLLVLVMNDGAYGAEFHKLAALGINAEEAVFGYVDFEAIVTALGGAACTPETLDQLALAVAEYLENPRFTVVDIRLSREVLAGRYRANYTNGEKKSDGNL